MKILITTSGDSMISLWDKTETGYCTMIKTLQSTQCKTMVDGVTPFPFQEAVVYYDDLRLDRWEYEVDGVLFTVFNS